MLVVLGGCGPIIQPPWRKNPACERARESNLLYHPAPESRNENIGSPAYSLANSMHAEAFALDGDVYLHVIVFVDRYGESPENTREAAVRLLHRAISD